jgi:hypothetical protein
MYVVPKPSRSWLLRKLPPPPKTNPRMWFARPWVGGSSSRTRTWDPAVNSRLLYRLVMPRTVPCSASRFTLTVNMTRSEFGLRASCLPQASSSAPCSLRARSHRGETVCSPLSTTSTCARACARPPRRAAGEALACTWMLAARDTGLHSASMGSLTRRLATQLPGRCNTVATSRFAANVPSPKMGFACICLSHAIRLPHEVLFSD